MPLNRYSPHRGAPISTGNYVSISPEQLREAAKILDKGLDARINPELESWNPKFAGCDIPFDLTELAESIISEG